MTALVICLLAAGTISWLHYLQHRQLCDHEKRVAALEQQTLPPRLHAAPPEEAPTKPWARAQFQLGRVTYRGEHRA